MLKLNNKGFAISGILYATLILFLILMLGTLSTLASGKFLLDKTKNDLIDKLNGNETIEIIMDYTKVNVVAGTEYVLNPLDGISAYNSAGEKIEVIDYNVYPEFDIDTIGTYQITYTVTVGNTTEKAVRIINVTDDLLPQIFDFSYIGAAQTFVVPQTGTYKLEVWGAKGGGSIYGSYSWYGGYGGYSTGLKNLTAGQILYLYIGSVGENKTSTNMSSSAIGGFNGGGNGGTSMSYIIGAGGGGATDVRTIGGDWNNLTSLNSRIIVAGGGGGTGYGTQNGTISNPEISGGYGGGTTGLTGTYYSSYGQRIGAVGNQVAGGAGGTNGASTVGFAGTLGAGGNGANGNAGGGGGGGGYYGGGGGADGNGCSGSGGGGSGYIGGVTSGQTIAGNQTMPNPDGGTMTGRSGDGFVRITRNP